MTAYLYAWEDGTVSLVVARDRLHAVDILDEIGDAEAERLKVLSPRRRPDVLVTFQRVLPDGAGDQDVELLAEQFSEGFADALDEAFDVAEALRREVRARVTSAG